MLFTSSIVAAAMALLANSATAAPLEQRATDDGYGLSIAGGRFDFSYLQSYRLFFANNSAYIGQIKYEKYSEPLVVQGAGVNGAGDGVSFLSIHSSPTGYQNMYVIPHQSQPVGFSVAHGSAPTNARIGTFTFGSGGDLLNNGLNLFYACQNGAEAAINSYQVWWIGDVQPSGFSCIGPISIRQSDGCARL